MSQDTVYKTKKMSQKDLEKHFGVKLNNEEFNVVKDLAFNDHEEVVGDDQKFYPFDIYLLSIKQWGTKSGKVRKNPRYQWDDDLISSIPNRRGSFGLESTDRFYSFRSKNLLKTYIEIQEEIDNRDPKLERKRESIREHNKQELKENKKNYTTSAAPDPDLIIGLVIFVFLTWLIFGVILGGGDLSPSGPSFFGHDGG